MHIDYDVSFADFLVSMGTYRRRSLWLVVVYAVDVWLLPIVGGAGALAYAYGFFRYGSAAVDGWGWIAAVGFAIAIGLPLLYRARLKRLYKLRTSLTTSGRVAAEFDGSAIHFRVGDNAVVTYAWSAFTHYAERDGVITMFVGDAAFHTLPRRSISMEQWGELQRLLQERLQKSPC